MRVSMLLACLVFVGCGKEQPVAPPAPQVAPQVDPYARLQGEIARVKLAQERLDEVKSDLADFVRLDATAKGKSDGDIAKMDNPEQYRANAKKIADAIPVCRQKVAECEKDLNDAKARVRDAESKLPK